MERRKFPRIPLNVKVKYDVLKGSPRRTEEARSKNVSAEGICLTISEKIDIGALLRLKLFLQGEDDFITVSGGGQRTWLDGLDVHELNTGISTKGCSGQRR